MTIRIELAPGDHHDIDVRPFDQLTVEDHIRLYESNDEDKGGSTLEVVKARLVRMTGMPSRFVRAMNADEVSRTMEAIDRQISANDATMNALARVHETLDKWEEEHDGQPWTIHDAQAVMDGLGIFKDSITVAGKTFTAPDVSMAPFGKWIDLSAAMSIPNAKESESFVRACAIMMDGPDGPYPTQGEEETDLAYADRGNAYTEERRKLFTKEARFVDVLGCAAFFFSKSEHFAAITAHSMPSLRALRQHGQRPEAINLQSVTVPTPN
jgi:hypothetical protein